MLRGEGQECRMISRDWCIRQHNDVSAIMRIRTNLRLCLTQWLSRLITSSTTEVRQGIVDVAPAAYRNRRTECATRDRTPSGKRGLIQGRLCWLITSSITDITRGKADVISTAYRSRWEYSARDRTASGRRGPIQGLGMWDNRLWLCTADWQS